MFFRRYGRSRSPSPAPRVRLRGFELLEDRSLPSGSLVAAADAGAPPEVRVFDADSGVLRSQFLAYDATNLSGVRVAVGDLNGDGFDDLVTAPGPNSAPNVRVYDGKTGSLIASFYAYNPNVTAGVFVAVGDLLGNGQKEIITSLGAGAAPHVEAFKLDGTVIASFYAYQTNFTGGVRVASGDLRGDGKSEIITGVGFGGGPQVQAFDLSSGSPVQVSSFYAYAPNVTTGVFVASGDINGDGKAEIITGTGAGGGPQVQAFNASGTALLSFYAFAPSFAGGVRVSAADINGNGVAEIIASTGYGTQPIVTAFDRFGVPGTSFYSFPAGILVGSYVTGSKTALNLISTPSDQIQAAYQNVANLVQAGRPIIVINGFNNFLGPYPYGLYGFGFGAYYPFFYDAPGLFYTPGYFYGPGYFSTTSYITDPGFYDPGYYYDSTYSDPGNYDPGFIDPGSFDGGDFGGF